MSGLDELSDDEYRELHGVWLSRLMLNQFVGWEPETRSFEEYVASVVPVCEVLGDRQEQEFGGGKSRPSEGSG